MKNRDLLPVGAKPAPDELAFVQGYANLLRFIQMRREIDGVAVLKKWLVRHGLLAAAGRVDQQDLRLALSFHDALRGLIRANEGTQVEASNVRRLNRLVGRFNLAVVFAPDGSARLEPLARGVEKALGRLLAVVIQAMADGSWRRLKACGNPDCQWVYYDSSKNNSGRWCSMLVCGGRAKARTYRQRRASRQ
ncbi:MAG: CGNR zinc finger domain-containing protein [candidate division Zixibacteria bacterium]|nr:CGNR zinc finger domain-containing protein [candidate division Zixibacteria bacterium]